MSISRHQAVGAYRRWTPEDFDAREAPPPPAGADAAAAAEPEAVPDAPEPAYSLPPDLKLPTAEEIERMHEEIRNAAREEGWREGHEAGLAAGTAEGERKGYEEGKARTEAEAARVLALAERLEQSLAEIDREVAEELMALAIELARQMVHHTLRLHPETVLDTIRIALQQLPQGNAQIRLHPDDLALVRDNLGEQLAQAGHRLQEDFDLQRGECRIDTQGAQLDATLETRWRRVLESLGREHMRFSPADPDRPASGTPDAAA
ncbi:flagellar assembly protein FliH [Thauera butanivorans]|uniref:flagellar assembly protein FliH n=1 Tax=Thauera butanivorans TaxID=86174 RepID=UPI000837C368|nr:flagellar assembly protein FliH [Thauera butanivorans]